jgi:hypothetical protein
MDQPSLLLFSNNMRFVGVTPFLICWSVVETLWKSSGDISNLAESAMDGEEVRCWVILAAGFEGAVRGSREREGWGLESESLWGRGGFREGSEWEERGEWDSASPSPLDSCGEGDVWGDSIQYSATFKLSPIPSYPTWIWFICTWTYHMFIEHEW